LLMLIYILYFNGHIAKSEYGFHALDNASFLGSITWLGTHMIYGFFLVFLGLGLKLLVYSIENNTDKYLEEANDTIITSLIVIVVSCYIIRKSHKQFHWGLQSKLLRGLSIFFIALGYFNRGDAINPEEIVGVAVCAMFVIVMLDLYLKPREDILQFMHEEGEHAHEEDEDDSQYILSLPRQSEISARSPSAHSFNKAKGVHRSKLVDSASMMVEQSARRSQGLDVATLKTFRLNTLNARPSMLGLQAFRHSDSEEECEEMSIHSAQTDSQDIQFDYVAEDTRSVLTFAPAGGEDLSGAGAAESSAELVNLTPQSHDSNAVIGSLNTASAGSAEDLERKRTPKHQPDSFTTPE